MREITSETVSVLYVEDESGTRMQVMHLLKQYGYRCFVAENGREGLELYRQHSPDIVLADIVMPVMDGLEMARQIRAGNPDAQLIVFTAFDNRENMLAAIDIGVSRFVVKPVEPAKLIAAISHCVDLIHWKAQYQKVNHLEAVNTLAGGMAHDFNNLLQVIVGYVDLAKRNTEPDSKALPFLDMIGPSTSQALKLSEQLLALADSGFGRREEKLLPTLIKTTINSVFNDAQFSCEFDLPADLPAVPCNAGQIQQVIKHLALNACEAMPQGGTLRVSAEVRSADEQSHFPLPFGDYLHITFRDNGRGVPPENLRKIFDPYFSTKQMGKQKGAGLGLTVCHSIIHQHGGMLTVSSKPGTGATFNFWLPVTPQAAA